MASRQYFNNYLINPGEKGLINSIYSHNYEELKELLSSGQSPDIKAVTGQYSGKSALFCAIGVQDMTLTKMLLKAGANINQIIYGHTPLTYALTHQTPGSVIEVLLEFKPDTSIEVEGHANANIFASHTINENTFNKYFESKHVNINLQNSQGMSALIGLIKGDRADYRRIHKLLDLGANVILKDSDGQDALDWARSLKKENAAFFKKLQKMYDIQNVRDRLFSTIPLQAASSKSVVSKI